MPTLLLILILILPLSGCAKLAHLDQLLTLKAYSDDKEIQAQYVQQQDEKFKKLLAAVQDNRLTISQNKKDFIAEYGDPVFTRTVVKDGTPRQVCLYRYAVKYFGSEKVYAYFDTQDLLQSWEYVSTKE